VQVSADGPSNGEGTALLDSVAEPPLDLVVRIFVHDGQDTVPLAGTQEFARRAQNSQVDPTSGIVVPYPHAGPNLLETSAGNTRLAAGMDNEAEAFAPVELLPPERKALILRVTPFLAIRSKSR